MMRVIAWIVAIIATTTSAGTWRLHFGSFHPASLDSARIAVVYASGLQADSVNAVRIAEQFSPVAKIRAVSRGESGSGAYLRWCLLNWASATKSEDLVHPRLGGGMQADGDSHLTFFVQQDQVGFAVWTAQDQGPIALGRVLAPIDSVKAALSASPQSIGYANYTSQRAAVGKAASQSNRGEVDYPNIFTPRNWHVFVSGGVNISISDDEQGDPNVPSGFQNLQERFDFNDLAEDGPLYLEFGLEWYALNWVGFRLYYAPHPVGLNTDIIFSLERAGIDNPQIYRYDVGGALTIGPWLSQYENQGIRIRPYGLLGVQRVNFRESYRVNGRRIETSLIFEDVNAVQVGAGTLLTLKSWLALSGEAGARFKDFRLKVPEGEPQPDGTGNEIYLRASLCFGNVQ
jgi:hypothetical protein